jgi:hypothetical protein
MSATWVLNALLACTMALTGGWAYAIRVDIAEIKGSLTTMTAITHTLVTETALLKLRMDAIESRHR